MFTTNTLQRLISFIYQRNLNNFNDHYPIISLNNRKVLGFIDCYTFENGFSILVFDIRVLASCIVKNDTINTSLTKNFFFVYFSEDTSGIVKLENGKEQTIEGSSFSITPGDNAEIYFKKGTSVNVFVFVATESWLQQQDIHFKRNYFSPLCNDERLLVKNLARYQGPEKNLIRLRITAYNLLLYSLERQTNKRKMISSAEDSPSETLQAIEQKILDHLYTSAPSIEEIAKEFYISPSTLKRQFKRVFGFNIYEYYLKHKMLLAKDILEKKQLKVSEVAAHLHYENVSQFIRMFKKINGFLPGQITK